MALIDRLQAQLQRHPKRIVFPEGNDPRIMQAARQFATRRLGVPILLGNRTEIKERALQLNVRLDGMRIIEPERSDDLDLFLPMFDDLPRFASLEPDEKRAQILDHNYFAALMLATGRVDGLIAGATASARRTLRPLFQIVPLMEGVQSASSLLILDQEEGKFGHEGAIFLADCGVIPEPNASQLADIALGTADVAAHLTGVEPRVAFLSFATASANPKHPSIPKIREALALAQQRAQEQGMKVQLDGEMQVDTALDAQVAQQKGLGDSPVAGRANVLVFPDLNSGNIASKMVQMIAGVAGYGQILTGLSRPSAEISRGAHAIDIFGTAVLVGARAIDRQFLIGPPLPSVGSLEPIPGTRA